MPDTDHELCGSFCECDVTPDGIAAAHEEALLDNQPCERCGRIEMDLRHRGTGHIHAPGGNIPAHVAGVMIKLDSWHVYPDDVIDIEHAVALAENEQRRLTALANAADTPVYVADTVRLILDTRNHPDDVIGYDWSVALIEDYERDWEAAEHEDHIRSAGHTAEPHSRRPGECRICRRPIVAQYVKGRRADSVHV